MTRIAHLSDLHFGRTDQAQLDALASLLVGDRIDHVIVTGDLTQQGRKREFVAAAAWLRELPMKVTAIPGNHDAPVRNLYRRFAHPWRRYERCTGFEAEPVVVGEGFVFAGANSARRFRPGLDWSTGALTRRQTDRVLSAFRRHKKDVKMVGFHHPVQAIETAAKAGKAVVSGADRVIDTLADAHVDVVMTGHVHLARVTTIKDRNWRFVMSQAGTAVSTRLRGEPASYNVLDLGGDDMRIETHRWAADGFAVERSTRFLRGPGGWVEAA
ncbi:metallophosphoesterase family protein [Parvularcula dongshanensis]|uniref:3',5'-cyclic AMP phosphodiesterase CpdA n=1 Tax=Parvularcula dongshanensis TaxID=1173995 RepID=A0A840HYJ8_9PROT|nr:metallophosphoesterase [Parvularcula dongshanensis]MBB4657649.1 3',5'-cyclic AMP phosphodiesterase CpdA [Parvularcula dongshanensis]